MVSNKVILSTNLISKYFYTPVNFRVLNNISIEAKKGEFLTLMGKSGSGKSTLLYCLSTMDTKYEGELFIDGELITGKSVNYLAALRNKSIGFVFQFHYLLPEFTCIKNIMLPALRLGHLSYKEIEHNAYEKMAMLGIEEQALKQASKLSGGQQQRVSIARALINNPAIIMCDEPTGNLDSRNTKLVYDIFRKITNEYSQTIIAVTHDHDFASGSDRIIELADGSIVE